MIWLLPTPLLLSTGVVAPWPLTVVGHRPVSEPRVLVEAFDSTGAVIAVFWLRWVDLWRIEQRWRWR